MEEKTTHRIEDTGSRPGSHTVTAIQWLSPLAASPYSVLDRRALTLGRTSEADVTLVGDGVSRRHAELFRQGPVFAVRDTGSTNGTFVNGRRIQQTALSEGDVLRFGDVAGLVVRIAPGECAPVAARELVSGMLLTPGLQEVLAAVQVIAPSDLPVVILGETGVGKECVARAVHTLSGRQGLFHAVNCAALPTPLAEAELFGYRKGAFTGAEQAAVGHFRTAHRGTLLLDELADLPLAIQAKFLRVLQERQVVRLGESVPVDVDVRILAASQRDLKTLVSARVLREDVEARLNGFVIAIPPLRDRRRDIAVLFEHFLKLHSGGRPPLADGKLIEWLLLHDWPANVRELELLTRRLLVLAGSERVLRRTLLPAELSVERSRCQEGSAPPPPDPEPSHADTQPPGATRHDHDLRLLARMLRQYAGNLTRAADAAGISRQRAYRLLGNRSARAFLEELDELEKRERT